MGIIFLLIGILMIAFWFILRRRATQSLRWPSVPGHVIDSKMTQSSDEDGTVTYTPSITYAYEVGGTNLRGSLVAFGGAPGKPADVLSKYPAGSDVRVFYNPSKPKMAVLEPGGGGLRSLLIISVVFLAIGVVVTAAGSKSSGNDDTQAYNNAVNLYNQAKYDQARSAFDALAHRGNPQAKVYIGVMYVKSQGVQQDLVEAHKWFILAGDIGKSNRDALVKSLTPAQQEQADRAAKAWQ